MAADSVPIAGKLRNYRLGIDLPDGQAHDNWERAAMLIHEKYVAATPEAKRNTPVTVPWAKLSPFYRESNRRQVHNALRTVEQVGGHTWNTWGDAPDELTPEALDGLAATATSSSGWASPKMPSTRWPRPSSRTGAATSPRGMDVRAGGATTCGKHHAQEARRSWQVGGHVSRRSAADGGASEAWPPR